ncbi:MAG TPA: hypothetical protein VIL86_18715 [Tepidisphaeraceae bacterium]
MRRKLFTFLAGISLPLLIAVVGLGVRGYFRLDDFYYQRTASSSGDGRHRDLLDLLSARGRLMLEASRCSVLTDEGLHSRHGDDWDGLHHGLAGPRELNFADNRLGQTAGRFGFGLAAYFKDPDQAYYPFDYASGIDILLPSWFLALLFSLLPALRLRRWLLDRQRNRPGFCRQCGYDLRATPGRCPECGMVVGQ